MLAEADIAAQGIGPRRAGVAVIIVSYNTRRMTLDCLRALFADPQAGAWEVWVVDNASADGSAAAVREAYPQVRVIENRENRGFGAANNQAMARAEADYFLLLNSDAFPPPGAVGTLVDYAEANPEVGVVGPRLRCADGSLQISCFRFPTPTRAWLENFWLASALPSHPKIGDYRRWAHDAERRVDFVIGACMLVRRAAYDQVGGFDERFFMYAEEADWQRRLQDGGWRVAFTPAAEVVHLGGASGTGEKARVNRHFFDSLDFYQRKHHGAGGLVSLRAAMTVGCFLRMLLWALVYAAVPGRRPVAGAKAGLMAWLVVRQATHWRLGRANGGGA